MIEILEQAVFEAITYFNKHEKYPDVPQLADYLKDKMELEVPPKTDGIYKHCTRMQRDGWIIFDFNKKGYKVAK